jgi:hypothetical protein
VLSREASNLARLLDGGRDGPTRRNPRRNPVNSSTNSTPLYARARTCCRNGLRVDRVEATTRGSTLPGRFLEWDSGHVFSPQDAQLVHVVTRSELDGPRRASCSPAPASVVGIAADRPCHRGRQPEGRCRDRLGSRMDRQRDARGWRRAHQLGGLLVHERGGAGPCSAVRRNRAVRGRGPSWQRRCRSTRQTGDGTAQDAQRR